MTDIFKENEKMHTQFCETHSVDFCNTERICKSSIPYMQYLLNHNSKNCYYSEELKPLLLFILITSLVYCELWLVTQLCCCPTFITLKIKSYPILYGGTGGLTLWAGGRKMDSPVVSLLLLSYTMFMMSLMSLTCLMSSQNPQVSIKSKSWDTELT